jgi:hypothetical protein
VGIFERIGLSWLRVAADETNVFAFHAVGVACVGALIVSVGSVERRSRRTEEEKGDP